MHVKSSLSLSHFDSSNSMTLFRGIYICVLVFPTYCLHLLVLRLHLYGSSLPFLPLYSSSSMASAEHFRPRLSGCDGFHHQRAVATLRVCFLRACLCVLCIGYLVMFHAFLASHTYVNSNISVVFFIANFYFSYFFPSLAFHLYLFVFVKNDLCT